MKCTIICAGAEDKKLTQERFFEPDAECVIVDKVEDLEAITTYPVLVTKEFQVYAATPLLRAALARAGQ